VDLVLVRHAVAFERDFARWPDDARRPLTSEGAIDFERTAKRLGRIASGVELVESSGFDRAWATAEILRHRAGWPRPRRVERLEPREDDGVGAERLHALARSAAAMRGLRTVVWVGHEPMLSACASLLLAGSVGAVRIDFRKGAAICLRLPSDGQDAAAVIGRAELRWMVDPRVVRRLRRKR
jgi:phosphohistidine phosphatase SixA